MKQHAKPLLILLCVLLALPLSGCGEGTYYEKQIFSMDTYMTLTAYGKNAEDGLSSAIGVINSLDAMLDPENENSSVYALSHAGGESVVVPGQVVEMLQTAQLVSDRSKGALDLGIYPLVKAWGFVDGANSDPGFKLPDKDEIAELLKKTGFPGAEITAFTQAGSYLVTVPDGTELSFGAVAKGCAAKYAISSLRASGVTSAIVSLGGNVQTLGKKPDGSNWNIAVQDPTDTGSYVGILSLGESAVVTSGGYQRYFIGPEGERLHHILDPKTGSPADSGLLSVTVVCEDGVMADALSTALFVMGEKKALDYWRSYGDFEMVLVTEDMRVVTTGGLYDSFQTYGEKFSYEFASKEA